MLGLLGKRFCHFSEYMQANKDQICDFKFGVYCDYWPKLLQSQVEHFSKQEQM